MTYQRTLSIIKPDAIEKNLIGKIIDRFETNGLRVAACKLVQLSEEEARQFYAVHKERPFYKDLTSFISSGPILAMVLEGENAIEKNRQIMGATNPKEADEGTIRKDFAASIDENAVHGSDAEETARTEIAFFFDQTEILPTRKARELNS